MKTYGRLQLAKDQSCWKLADLAPHVAIALKRLFPKIPEWSTEIILADNDNTRADIHWFMLRYPMDVGQAEKKALDDGVERVATKAAEREAILLTNWEPSELPKFKDDLAPYKFQTQAAAVALQNPGLLLGDDVGLGKTISAIATLAMGAPLPAAVVVESHLARQWARQITRFCNMRVHVIKGKTPYSLPTADIYIFRYSNIIGWIDILDKGGIRTVVYDEIQQLRHGTETSKGRAAEVLSKHAELRMGLTATPVYNYGDEMHTVMEYVQPGLLGSRQEFMREWCGGGSKVKDPDALGSYLRDSGYFLRRREDDDVVDASMPPANIIDFMVDHDDAAEADELKLMQMLAQKVLSGSFMEAGQAARELDLKMRMITGVSKARSVAAYVKLLLNDCERVLLGGWHREVYSIWQRELERFNPVLYTGTESAAGKDRSIQQFTEGNSRVMMLSLRSGAGLDGLQHYCHDAVFGEFDWSPQVHYQFMGRLRRPGQMQQVNGHYLHTNFGSDPVLLEMLGVKADQSRGITDPGQQMAQKQSDDSRIKRLAEFVLEGA